MKTKQITIFVPGDTPGRTIIERTRAVIAAGFAASRTSDPDATPSDADRGAAAKFRTVKAIEHYDGTTLRETEVTIEGKAKDIEAYAKTLEQVE